MTAPCQLSDQQVAFVESGVVIVAAASNAAGKSIQVFALGCRYSTPSNRLTIFLPPSKCRQLMAYMRDSNRLAIVFCQPYSHVTLQIKGNEIACRSLDPTEQLALDRYMQDLIVELRRVGEEEAYVRTIMAHSDEDILAVELTPQAVFSQTPGLQAGRELRDGELIHALADPQNRTSSAVMLRSSGNR